MALDVDVDVRIKRLKEAGAKTARALDEIERKDATKNAKIAQLQVSDQEERKLEISKIRKAQHAQDTAIDEIVALLKRERDKLSKDKLVTGLRARISELESQAELNEEPEPEDPSLVKAKTVAIFDSILFAIENWSTDGDTAPDFSLACQSILFPLVYSQVMNGNEHYFLKTVPTASIEVVKRGREYVKFIRGTCQVGLTDPEAWSVHVPMIAKWWVNDALPLLYGARDDVWERVTPLTLEAIMSWRDKPASRALEFPLVFDAMDLLDRHREEIREKTNLPEFTRETLNTRLEAN